MSVFKDYDVINCERWHDIVTREECSACWFTTPQDDKRAQTRAQCRKNEIDNTPQKHLTATMIEQAEKACIKVPSLLATAATKKHRK